MLSIWYALIIIRNNFIVPYFLSLGFLFIIFSLGLPINYLLTNNI